MKYPDLRHKLKDYRIFSIRDVEKASDRQFHRRRLNDWQDKNYIKKIVKGYYLFSDVDVTQELLFKIANTIYKPSYISLETALSFYNLIPEAVFGITSVSTKKTYQFDTKVAKFSYRKIKRNLFFGYVISKNGKNSYKIASIEKAILDYLYIHSKMKKEEDFISLRLNKHNFLKQYNKVKLLDYLQLFANKSLSYRVNNFLRYIEND